MEKEVEVPLTFQQKVDGFFNKKFGRWGQIVAINPKKVFFLSLLMFMLLATGITEFRRFEDEEVMWSPRNNPSIKAKRRSQEMFTDDGDYIGALFEVKDKLNSNANILTLQCFQEMN